MYGTVYDRTRAWLRPLSRLRPARPDAVLAAVFVVAGVLLATRAGHRDEPGIDGRLLIDSQGHRELGLPARGLVVPGPGAPLGVGPQLAAGPSHGAVAAAIGMSLLVTAVLAWRRRLPLAVFAVQLGAVFAIQADANWAVFLAILIGAFSLVMHGRRPLVSLGVLLAVAVLVALTFDDSAPDLPGWSAPFVIFGLIALVGIAIRAAHGRADAQAQRAALLERQQQVVADAAVAAERSRIARELHDVVSHHVSVITIQAGAAGKVLDSQPERARQAVAAIEASGREAMSELRHLLGVLAPPADLDLAESAPLDPQPGLDQLAGLIDKVRAAGQPVTVRTTTAPLPHGLELTAYRVVQEALTNALRYAPGARTEVIVDRTADTLLIEVANDAFPRSPFALPPAGPAAEITAVDEADPVGTGSGLVGLAERLRLYRGTLEAGRRLGGGFRVRATIPLELG